MIEGVIRMCRVRAGQSLQHHSHIGGWTTKVMWSSKFQRRHKDRSCSILPKDNQILAVNNFRDFSYKDFWREGVWTTVRWSQGNNWIQQANRLDAQMVWWVSQRASPRALQENRIRFVLFSLDTSNFVLRMFLNVFCAPTSQSFLCIYRKDWFCANKDM